MVRASSWFLLLWLSGVIFSQSPTEQQLQLISPTWIMSDWRTIAVLASFTALLLLGILYIVAIAFSNREFIVFVHEELVQALITIALVVFLIGGVTFLDSVIMSLVGDLGYSSSQELALDYLTQQRALLRSAALTIMQNNIEYLSQATRLEGTQMRYQTLLWAGTFFRPNAGVSIYSEEARVLFNNAIRLIGAVEFQISFIRYVLFPIGPLLMAMGVVFRSFYFTRKLGGMFLATAVGIIFVWPSLYILPYLLFSQTSTSIGSVVTDTSSCPLICTAKPPRTYTAGGNTLECIPQNPSSFTREQLACMYCGDECRKIPTPSSCMRCNISNPALLTTTDLNQVQLLFQECPELACYECPADCKINLTKAALLSSAEFSLLSQEQKEFFGIKEGSTHISFQEYCTIHCSENKCPSPCRLKPSLKENCKDCIGTFDGPTFRPYCVSCRIKYYTTEDTNPLFCSNKPPLCTPISLPPGNDKQREPDTSTYSRFTSILSTHQQQSCFYATTDYSQKSCDNLCSNCPSSCRISSLPSGDFSRLRTYDNLPCPPQCASCPSHCKGIIPSYGTALCELYARSSSSSCPEQCRIFWPGADLTSLENIRIGDTTNCKELCIGVPLFNTLPTDKELSECKFRFSASDFINCNEVCAKCPPSCRVLGVSPEYLFFEKNGVPTPCTEVQSQCASCPSVCFARYRSAPSSCQNCEGCPSNCRVSDISVRNFIRYPTSGGPAPCASADCSSCTCMREGPPTTIMCNDPLVCGSCPYVCRELGVDLSSVSTFDPQDNTLKKCSEIAGCRTCSELCMRSVETNPSAPCDILCFDPSSGVTCPEECRINDAALPQYCYSDACAKCPRSCKATIPHYACDRCTDCPSTCLSIPPIPDCASLCGPLSPRTGIILTVGDTGGTRAIGRLYIPAFVLPVINLVLLIAFIRTFSPLLGGDIELPGKGRVL